jgi:beta-fructofuranosidase
MRIDGESKLIRRYSNMLYEANQYIKANKDKVNSQYRLNYHLMGQCGWINDPNGFIHYKDKYHLFYQHNPYDAVPGLMYWGHAVSDDLIKWNYLPIALAPDKPYDKDGCFSGSSMEANGRLYLMYTGHVVDGGDQRETQCLAYSDDAINFAKYKGNPVISIEQIPNEASKKDFRDPRVFKRNGKYYVVIGSNDGKGKGQVLIYTSLDMLHWVFLRAVGAEKNMGNNCECPDMFRLQDRDVLIVSLQYLNEEKPYNSSVYAIGHFDESVGDFIFDRCFPLDYGFDFYAPQTTEDVSSRRIIVAWMNEWGSENPTYSLGHNWAGAMTLPREVLLKDGMLCFKPVDEIKTYRRNEFSMENIEFEGERNLDAYGDSYEIEASFDARSATEFGLKLRTGYGEETVLSYNRAKKIFSFDRNKSGIGPKGEKHTEVELDDNVLTIRAFVDKCSVEVFINDGRKVMTGRIYPSKDSKGIRIFSRGACKLLSLKKWDIA